VRLVLSCLALLLCLVAFHQAHADTYSVFTFANDNETPIGITADGTVVTRYSLQCSGSSATSCYVTYTNGVAVNRQADLPSLTFDNGSACTVDLPSPFMSQLHNVCNNGRYATSTGYDVPGTTQTRRTTIVGPDVTILGDRSDLILLNSEGDVVFVDGGRGRDFLAFDLTTRASVTPEPNGLALLGTGMLGIFGALRRKLL